MEDQTKDQQFCVKNKIITSRDMLLKAEENDQVSIRDQEHDLTVHKIILRHASNPLFTDRNLNMLKVILAANLKTHLATHNLLPAKYAAEYEMEVIHDLLLHVEKWLKEKLIQKG